MRNAIEFSLIGKTALFSDPLTRVGGEKFSYPIPTYQALKGIVESIYWKPTIIWYIDEVKIINPIRTQARGVKPMLYDESGNDLAIYQYLVDVHYHVKAHFEFNMNRPDLKEDRNENKHHQIALRMLSKGGRRDIFLGARECQGYVEPIIYGQEIGAYDDVERMEFGLMFHGFNYPDETGKEHLETRFWTPVMKNGVIKFPRPEACTIKRTIREMWRKEFTLESIEDSESLFERIEL